MAWGRQTLLWGRQTLLWVRRLCSCPACIRGPHAVLLLWGLMAPQLLQCSRTASSRASRVMLAALVPDTVLLNLLQPQPVLRSCSAGSRGRPMAPLPQLQEIACPRLRGIAKPQLLHCSRLASGRVPGAVPHLQATISQGRPSLRCLPRLPPPVCRHAAPPQLWLRRPVRRLQAVRIAQDLQGTKRMSALACKRLLRGRTLASSRRGTLPAR